MLIGRSDDPQNPCRVVAFKVSVPFGSGSRNPSGPAAPTAQTGRTHDRNRTRSGFSYLTPCVNGAVHTRPALAVRGVLQKTRISGLGEHKSPGPSANTDLSAPRRDRCGGHPEPPNAARVYPSAGHPGVDYENPLTLEFRNDLRERQARQHSHRVRFTRTVRCRRARGSLPAETTDQGSAPVQARWDGGRKLLLSRQRSWFNRISWR